MWGDVFSTYSKHSTDIAVCWGGGGGGGGGGGMFSQLTLVHRTCTKTAAFHLAPAMQQPKRAIGTPLLWILLLIICTIKGLSLIENHKSQATCAMSA